VNRKIFPSLERKKLKNEETAGKHLTDVAVLAWQDKKESGTFISTYHNGEKSTI
jgi:hypothetical protein